VCIVPAWREGGQAQYIKRPLPPAVATSTAATRACALAHLDQPLVLKQLAAHPHVSERTLTRRFREEVGTSPARWLLQQRIDRARTLLEGTSLSIERVADEAGFGTGAAMRQHLRAELCVSPTSYRRAFQGRKSPRRSHTRRTCVRRAVARLLDHAGSSRAASVRPHR
jgi:transcriptional regulator GlxA family with amidase domain